MTIDIDFDLETKVPFSFVRELRIWRKPQSPRAFTCHASELEWTCSGSVSVAVSVSFSGSFSVFPCLSHFSLSLSVHRSLPVSVSVSIWLSTHGEHTGWPLNLKIQSWWPQTPQKRTLLASQKCPVSKLRKGVSTRRKFVWKQGIFESNLTICMDSKLPGAVFTRAIVVQEQPTGSFDHGGSSDPPTTSQSLSRFSSKQTTQRECCIPRRHRG